MNTFMLVNGILKNDLLQEFACRALPLNPTLVFIYKDV
ncbi:unnamed protein product [Tenebrio molitor]|nr:unnamed protein product [Tenebrio molitor]